MYIKCITGIKITLSMGYLCREKINKNEVLKGRNSNDLKLSHIYSYEIQENNYMFGSCNESNIVDYFVESDDVDDLVVGYSIVLNPKPYIYGDKTSDVCYNFECDSHRIGIRKPINILDYTIDFFGDLIDSHNYDNIDYYVKEKLRKILYKYRNFHLGWIHAMKESVISNFDLRELDLKIFKDNEGTKRILLSLFNRLEKQLNVFDLVQFTYDDIFDAYIDTIRLGFNVRDKEFIKRRISENKPSKIYHFRRIFRMIIELDIILIYLIDSKGYEIHGNLYDPDSKIKNNTIECVKSLIIVMDYTTECSSISIFFLSNLLNTIKCYARDIAPKKIISIPKYEFTSQIKYIKIVNSSDKTEYIVNISKCIPDLLGKYYTCG